MMYTFMFRNLKAAFLLNGMWNGIANGGNEIARQDVYVWKVKLKDVFNKAHNYIGTVTLVK